MPEQGSTEDIFQGHLGTDRLFSLIIVNFITLSKSLDPKYN